MDAPGQHRYTHQDALDGTPYDAFYRLYRLQHLNASLKRLQQKIQHRANRLQHYKKRYQTLLQREA